VGNIEARLPEEPCLATVALWLEEGDGSVRARNYVNLDVHDGRSMAHAERTRDGYALPFRPGDFIDASWPTPVLGPKGQKFGASGAGWVEYVVTLLEELPAAAVIGMRLVFEAGARTASSRIGWKRLGQPADRCYP